MATPRTYRHSTRTSDDWRSVAGLAAVAGAIGILYFARDTFIPLAFAITLSLILSPPVGWLEKRGVHRVPAAILALTLTVALVSGVSYIIFNQLVDVVNQLPAYQATIRKKVNAFRRPGHGALERAAENVKQLGQELASAKAKPSAPVAVQMIDGPQNVLSQLRELVEPFLLPLGTLGIVLVFTVFLLIEQTDLRDRLFKLAGVSRVNLVTQAFDDATSRVSRYLLLQFVVNVAFGVCIGIGLWLIGLPYAALWGALVAILRIVPFLGSLVAAVLPLMLCLAVFDGWRQPALIFLLYSTLELITANFLEPWLYGSHTGISSLALLITAIFWATLWGPAGLILSTPLTVCVVVLGRHVENLSFLHVLLGDEVALPSEALLYQRLLAMDEQGAHTIVDEYRKEGGLVELYDKVLLPALAMAESDRHKGALTSAREEFVFLSVREMLAEAAETTERESRPANSRVLAIPAHDEADEIASSMLAQLLEQGGHAVVSFPLNSDVQMMLSLVKPAATDLFCISSVPPFAFPHAQSLATMLRRQFPETPILVGAWGFAGDITRASQRIKTDGIFTSLASAIEFIEKPVATVAASDS